MHIVSELDKPHIFLTLTCNNEWSEIKERIGKDQVASDRPDITTMVFHQRLEAFLKRYDSGKDYRKSFLETAGGYYINENCDLLTYLK